MVGVALLVAAVAVGRGGDDGGGATAPATSELQLTTSTSVGSSALLAPGTTAPLGSSGLGEAVAPEREGRSPLVGFGEVQATITAADGEVCEVCLLSAVSPEQRARGLMEVTDPELGGYDGMLFEYEADSGGGFWMRNTPLPLSIAYFAADGGLVSTVDMVPCEDAPDCPSYPAGGPFRFALEVPQGQLDEVAVRPGSTIRIDARRCDPATTGG